MALIDSGDALPVLLYTRDGIPAPTSGLPTLADVVPNGKFDRVVEFLARAPNRMFMASPATKADQVEALRAAFQRIGATPDFRAILAAEDRALLPTAGSDLAAEISAYVGASSDFTGLVASLLACGQKISDGQTTPCS